MATTKTPTPPTPRQPSPGPGAAPRGAAPPIALLAPPRDAARRPDRDGDRGPASPEPAEPGHGGAQHDHDEVDLNVPKPRRLWVVAAAVAVVLVLGALLVTGFLPRHGQNEELAREAKEKENAPVLVNAVRPTTAPAMVEITLPGTLRPWQEVSLFARTAGYLRKYYFDISQQVKAGDLLAEIDTPEVDQELRQAQAALAQTTAAVAKAVADRDLAKVTAERTQTLLQQKYVSNQEADEKRATLNSAESNLQSAQANVHAAEANVQRLTEMKQFQEVRAPFAGVVTGRAYDVGSLITANPTAQDTKPMFKLAENDIVRAFVNVPQSVALQIRKGMEVRVLARERPNRVYAGYVMGTTNYLDPAARSLLTEVKVPNVTEPGGEFALLPGMFVQVNFAVHRDAPPLMIPGPAIINGAQGNQVAVIRDGKAHFQKVALGQDNGTAVEVVDGVKPDDLVIANPGERIIEGASVKAAVPENTGGGVPATPREKVAEAGGK